MRATSSVRWVLMLFGCFTVAIMIMQLMSVVDNKTYSYYTLISSFHQEGNNSTVREKQGLEYYNSNDLISSNYNLTSEELFKVKKVLDCEGGQSMFQVGQRGKYVVFYNFVKSSKRFGCHESITFSAPADYTFLDNLPKLVDRWRGPVSVALYAPGKDFDATLKSIAYVRHCLNNSSILIRDFVTFHIFFHQEHVPKKNDRPLVDAFIDNFPCNETFHMSASAKDTYRRKNNILFPINVARNIARQSAQTHYVFAADIELYPSEYFIEKFLRMMSVHPEYVHKSHESPRIFVLPIFEIRNTSKIPENKTDLQAELRKGNAQLFHKRICAACHAIPNLTHWIDAKETHSLDVFTVGKRLGKHRVWEAFYVGTKEDPLFDENFTWEGQGNKMSQGFSMCLLNYDYMILNNAFIIHKPGIKHYKEQNRLFSKEVQLSNTMMKYKTKPMLIGIYGNRSGCYL